jgi:hypothetical protein
MAMRGNFGGRSGGKEGGNLIYFVENQIFIKQVQGTLKCLAPELPLLIPRAWKK